MSEQRPGLYLKIDVSALAPGADDVPYAVAPHDPRVDPPLPPGVVGVPLEEFERLLAERVPADPIARLRLAARDDPNMGVERFDAMVADKLGALNRGRAAVGMSPLAPCPARYCPECGRTAIAHFTGRFCLPEPERDVADMYVLRGAQPEPAPIVVTSQQQLDELYGVGFSKFPIVGSPEVACTGVAASWCPRCGDCSCPRNRDGERLEEGETCPLHGERSAHATDADRLEATRKIAGAIFEQALVVGQHWLDQEGVNAAELEKLAELVRSWNETSRRQQ